MGILSKDSQDKRFFFFFYQGLLLNVIFGCHLMLVRNGTVCIAGRNACKRNQMLMIFKHEASVHLSGDTQQGFEQRERERPIYEFERREKIMPTESCAGLLSAGFIVPSC